MTSDRVVEERAAIAFAGKRSRTSRTVRSLGEMNEL